MIIEDLGKEVLVETFIGLLEWDYIRNTSKEESLYSILVYLGLGYPGLGDEFPLDIDYIRSNLGLVSLEKISYVTEELLFDYNLDFGTYD